MVFFNNLPVWMAVGGCALIPDARCIAPGGIIVVPRNSCMHAWRRGCALILGGARKLLIMVVINWSKVDWAHYAHLIMRLCRRRIRILLCRRISARLRCSVIKFWHNTVNLLLHRQLIAYYVTCKKLRSMCCTRKISIISSIYVLHILSCLNRFDAFFLNFTPW